MRLSAQRAACSAHDSDADRGCAKNPRAVTVDCFGDLAGVHAALPRFSSTCMAKFTTVREEPPVMRCETLLDTISAVYSLSSKNRL
jgi:hypothetical protein